MHKVRILFCCLLLYFFIDSLSFFRFFSSLWFPFTQVVGHVVSDKSSSAPGGKKKDGQSGRGDDDKEEERGETKPTTKRWAIYLLIPFIPRRISYKVVVHSVVPEWKFLFAAVLYYFILFLISSVRRYILCVTHVILLCSEWIKFLGYTFCSVSGVIMFFRWHISKRV